MRFVFVVFFSGSRNVYVKLSGLNAGLKEFIPLVRLLPGWLLLFSRQSFIPFFNTCPSSIIVQKARKKMKLIAIIQIAFVVLGLTIICEIQCYGEASFLKPFSFSSIITMQRVRPVTIYFRIYTNTYRAKLTGYVSEHAELKHVHESRVGN